MKHLSETTKKILNSSIDDKINHIRKEYWINYDIAAKAIDQMQSLLSNPDSHRPDSIRLIGSSNNGKTMIIKKFEKNNPPYSVKGEDHFRFPVVSIQAPHRPSVSDFLSKILDAVNHPRRLSSTVSVKETKVLRTLALLKTKVLVVDEVHNILSTPAKQRQFINFLRYLSNELQISLVCAGLPKAANVLNSDEQMANRFQPIELPRWSYNKAYGSLLKTLEKRIPLPEPSNLTNKELSTKILDYSEGLIGEIVSLLRQVAIYAIKNDKAKIDITYLDEIGWRKPSTRKQLHVVL